MWSQLSGTPVDLNEPSSPILNVTSPDITEEETLEFNVIVSDGEQTTEAQISTKVEIFEPETIELTPSIYSGSFPISSFHSLVSNADGGYRVYWLSGSDPFQIANSYQDYTIDGQKLGPQVDSTFEISEDIDTFTTDVIQSGETRYNLNKSYNFEDESIVTFSTIRGDLSGINFQSGDIYYTYPFRDNSVRQSNPTPISNDRLLLTVTRQSENEGTDLTAIFINPDGTSSNVILSENNVMSPSTARIVEFGDQTFGAFWEQDEKSLSEEDDYDEIFVMQHFSDTGQLLGDLVKLNDDPTNFKSTLSVTQSPDGNAFVSWRNSGSDSDDLDSMSAQIIQADGSYDSDVFNLFSLPESLFYDSQTTLLPSNQVDENTSILQPFDLTTLADGQIIVSFNEYNSYEDGISPSTFETKALAFYPIGKMSN